MNKYLKGAIAGAVATVPMTIVMTRLFRELPTPQQRAPLPPVQITAELAERTNTRRQLTGHRLTAAALLAHFAYGAATGMPYSALAPRTRVTPAITGPVYGIAIWVASYLGWIPALRILPPATEHPKERNGLMLVAHVVWGAALAASVGFLERLTARGRI